MTPRFSPGALRVGLSALLADRPPANAAGLQLGDRWISKQEEITSTLIQDGAGALRWLDSLSVASTAPTFPAGFAASIPPGAEGSPSMLTIGGGLLQLWFHQRTTTAGPLVAFFASIPPVIGALLDVSVAVRDETNGDVRTWHARGQLSCTAGPVCSWGPLGLVTDWADAAPGAGPWGWGILLNSPAPGDLSFVLGGDAVLPLDWSISIVETLTFPF